MTAIADILVMFAVKGQVVFLLTLCWTCLIDPLRVSLLSEHHPYHLMTCHLLSIPHICHSGLCSLASLLSFFSHQLLQPRMSIVELLLLQASK